MASAYCDPSLTLAPFQWVYGDVREVALLADADFRTRLREAKQPPVENDEARVGAVIPMPSRARFEDAVARWQSEITFDSFPADMKEHESFGEIIEQGFGVVPLIAAQLRREPSFLFLALEEIFHEDPVPEEAYGDVRTVCAKWLEWLQR